MGKSNAVPVGFDLMMQVGKTVWESFPAKTRADLIILLQEGYRPNQIETAMRTIIERNHPDLPDFKHDELAGRYYMASLYALKNNLHLN